MPFNSSASSSNLPVHTSHPTSLFLPSFHISSLSTPSPHTLHSHSRFSFFQSTPLLPFYLIFRLFFFFHLLHSPSFVFLLIQASSTFLFLPSFNFYSSKTLSHILHSLGHTFQSAMSYLHPFCFAPSFQSFSITTLSQHLSFVRPHLSIPQYAPPIVFIFLPFLFSSKTLSPIAFTLPVPPFTRPVHNSSPPFPPASPCPLITLRRRMRLQTD